MTISKTTRTCLTNTRDDINSTLREVNARIDSHYYQSLGHGYKNVLNVALAHGVPTQIPNPLLNKATPFGAIAINCDTQGLPTLTTGLYSNGVRAATGYIWVTALYPLAEQYASMSTATSQSIANNSNAAITFSGTLDPGSVGTHIVASGSTLQVNLQGLYDVRAKITFAANGTGIRVAELQDSTGEFFGTQSAPADATVGSFLAPSAIIPMTAGDVVQVVVYQNSGGALGTGPTTVNKCRLQVRQLSNDASLTANVTFSLLAP